MRFNFERCCGCREGLLGRLVAAGAALGNGAGGGSQVLKCWSDMVHSSNCCNLRSGPTGKRDCWSGEYTYDRCCWLRQAPPVEASTCELAFRACPSCVALLGVPWFNRSHWQQCHRAGGSVSVAAVGLDAPVALCMPKHPSCFLHSEPLFSAMESQTYLPRFDVEECRPSWDALHVPLLLLLLAPFAWFAARRRLAGVCSEPWKPGRDASVDILRLVGAWTGVVRHLNFRKFVDGRPGVNHKGFVYSDAVNDFSGRLMDCFTVASVVLLARSPPRSAGEWFDKLWAKLSRQLPLMVVPWELLSTACTRVSSCSEYWPYGEVVRRHSLPGMLLFEECLWYTSVDLWTNIGCSMLLLLQQRRGLRSFWCAWVLLAACCLRQAAVKGPSHYDLWTYRLPLALLVLAAARSTSLAQVVQGWSPHIFWAVVGPLVGMGWCLCPRSASLWTDQWSLAPLQGWPYLLEGACFHLGLTLACLRGSAGGKQAPGHPPWITWLAGLSFAVVLVNGEDVLYTSMINCERGRASLWAFYEMDGAMWYFNAPDMIDRPRWVGLALRVFLGAAMVVVSQMAVWIVQRPWAAALQQVPRPVTRPLVALFLVAQLWRKTAGGGALVTWAHR